MPRPLSTSRALGALCLTALSASTSPARAAGVDRTVISVLQSDSGWTTQRTLDDGLIVRSKPAAGRTAFQGEIKLDAATDPDKLWRVINDIEGHKRVGDKLAEAVVFSRSASGMDYFQVMIAPTLMPGSQRYWFAHSDIEPAVDGNPNHRRRCWSNLPAGVASTERAGVRERHPRAIEVPLTHGCWEVVTGDGSTTLIYTTVSDPGGSIPDAMARTLTSRTLPENIRNFVRAARR